MVAGWRGRSGPSALTAPLSKGRPISRAKYSRHFAHGILGWQRDSRPDCAPGGCASYDGWAQTRFCVHVNLATSRSAMSQLRGSSSWRRSCDLAYGSSFARDVQYQTTRERRILDEQVQTRVSPRPSCAVSRACVRELAITDPRQRDHEQWWCGPKRAG
jgi:hypothetical protein